MDDSEQIGDLGELAVENWCTKAKLYINDSRRKDRKGWDYFIEWPDTFDNQDGYYTTINPRKCLVQVKASKDPNKSWSISLSNYKHLIDSPLPAIIVKITIDAEDEPIEASLIEIDKHLGKQFLKKVKDLEGEKLNKNEMSLNLNNQKIIEPITGKIFKKQLEEIICDFSKYLEQKAKWKKEIGYSSYEITFEVNSNDENEKELWERLIDFDLGIKEKLEVSDLDKNITWQGLKTNDFDPDKIESIRIEEGYNVLKTILSFGTIDGRLETKLEMNMYLPSIFARAVPEKFYKYRFTDDYLSITLDKRNNYFNISLPSIQEAISSISKFQNTNKFGQFLRDLTDEDLVVIDSYTKDNDELIFSSQLGKSLQQNELDLDELIPFRSTQIILEKLNISIENEINLRLVKKQKESINLIAQLIESGHKLFYNFELHEEIEESIEQRVISLYPQVINLGNIKLWLILSITGKGIKDEEKPKNLKIEDSKVFIEDSNNVNTKNYDKSLFYKSLLSSLSLLEGKYEESYLLLTTGDKKVIKDKIED